MHKPNRLQFLFAILCFAFFLSACKTTASISTKKQPDNGEVNPAGVSQESVRINFLFIEAATAAMNGIRKEALGNYRMVLELDPENHAAMYNIGKLYFEDGDYFSSIDWAEKAIKYDKANPWYYALLADSYEKIGEYEKTAQTLENLIKQDPENPRSYLNLSHVYLLTKKYDLALKSLEQLENKVGLNEEVSAKKYQIYFDKKDFGNALIEAERLIKINPSNFHYQEAKYQVLMALGLEDKAVQSLEQILEMDHDNGFAVFSLADYYKRKNDPEKSDSYLFEGFRNSKLEANGKLQILAGQFILMKSSEKEVNRANTLSQLLIQAHPKNGLGWGVRGDFFMETGKPDSAEYYFREAIFLDPSLEGAWMRLLEALNKKTDYPTLIVEAEKALEYFPDHIGFLFFFGIGGAKTGDTETAIYAFEKVKKMSFAPPDLFFQSLIQLGEVYHILGKGELSNENFDYALQLQPENDLVNNIYAFYLAERNERLDDAEEMAKKAIRIFPNLPRYEDTYGWILFKKGDFKKAEEWIAKSIEHGGNKEVFEHYGDVLFKLDQPQRALEFWEKAKKAGIENKALENKINSVKSK